MSPLLLLILAILLIPIAIVIAVVIASYAIHLLGRRRDQPHIYTEREVADTQRPLASGVVIVAPSHAPQNGNVGE